MIFHEIAHLAVRTAAHIEVLCNLRPRWVSTFKWYKYCYRSLITTNKVYIIWNTPIGQFLCCFHFPFCLRLCLIGEGFRFHRGKFFPARGLRCRFVLSASDVVYFILNFIIPSIFKLPSTLGACGRDICRQQIEKSLTYAHLSCQIWHL